MKSVHETRWRNIAERLREEILNGRQRPGSRLPSSADLAEQCGVSRLTAHKALSELQRLGLVKRDGRRGTVVLSREKRGTGRIALIMDQVDHKLNFPRPDLLAGIHGGLGEDYNLVLCDARASGDREVALLERMSKECDGILCWPTGDPRSAECLNRLASENYPLVLLDRVTEGVQCDAVVSDSVEGTRNAVQFLIERGHKRIALFAFDHPELSTVAERCGTFERILAEHELHAPELVRRLPGSLEVVERAHFQQAVYDALFTIVRGNDPATAIFCVQDLFGGAVMACAEQIGIEVPDALEVVTFNDWPPMWLRTPWRAHRITVQPEEMGKVAIQTLRAKIAGESDGPSIRKIPARFVTAGGPLEAASNLSPISQ